MNLNRNSDQANSGDLAESTHRTAGWFWPVLGLAAFLSLPYYFSLETFFSHDDFVILHFHKDWPVWKPWVFLRTDVLTFYRPLQSYSLALLYHFFDVTVFPYCLVLVTVHVANVVLFGRLVDRLFAARSLTFLSVIFYAANWEYCDVVFWKANYGTALSWLFALGAANTFVGFLRDRKRRHYIGTIGFTVAALLSKETAVNMPLLLTLIWAVRLLLSRAAREAEEGSSAQAATAGDTRRNARATVRDFVRVLGPLYALIGAYGVFHLLFVHDVYAWPPKGYEFATPIEAVEAVARGMTFWLTHFLEAGAAILAATPARPSLLRWLDHHPYILPVVLVAAAVALRNRRVIFGILWAVLAFFPANLIPDAHTARYYYAALTGIAIIYAEIFLAADRAIARRWRFPAVAAARVIGSLLILAIVYANMIYTTTIVGADGRTCRQIEDVYRFLVRLRQQGHIRPNTLFRVHCLSTTDHFHEGLGLREMFKLALRDDSIEAILPKQRLTDEMLEFLLKQYPPPVELLRLESGRFQLVTAGPTTRTATLSPPQ